MESSNLNQLEPVHPVQPPAKYIGGKRNLAKLITSIIERIPHSSYNEPCVGMGGIFFRRSRRPRSEAINDISGDVAGLFRILREHYPYFVDLLKWRLSSRAEFKRLLGMDPTHLTDLQRAARFIYLQRLGFGGKVDGRAFGIDAKAPARFDITKLEPMLADLAERLAGVTIEQLPFGEFIARYDHAGALFYIDPPYWGCEGDYGPGVFGRDDFAALAEQLGKIEGRFLVSINDRPEVREVFAGFAQLPVETTYTFASSHSGKAKRVGELVISNLPLEAIAPAANDA